jgi:hypothetical protein
MLFNRTILMAAAVTIVAACSSLEAEPNRSAATKSEALSAASTPPNGDPTGAVTLLDAGTPIDPKTAQAALSDPQILTELRGLALHASAVAGVASPKAIHVVAAADHQEAELVLSGATINDHAPVYVIEVTGGPFTALSHPQGVSAPQGKFLTLTLDAKTHNLTDVGFVDEEPDLTKIGPTEVDLGVQ